MKVRNNMAKVLAVGLALSQTFTAFAADLPTDTSVPSETNAASGNSKVILDNKYWYKVQLPGIIDLKFDETTQSYKDEFDINVSGQVPGKMLQIDTNDVEMTGTDDITVGNYVGQYDNGEKNHTYVYGSGEGDTDLTPEWAAIKSGADISAYGVKAGKYDGTAAYKFKLVDPSEANGSQIQLEDSKLVMGAGQSHQIEATLDGKDVTSDINWTSDNESIAKVTKSGNVVVSANAKSGDVVEISGTLPADYNEKETASILNSLSNAFGPMVVHAAGTEKTVSFTVSIVEINFDDTLTSIDKIELLPGEEMKVRAIIEPETEGSVSWSATRATGLGLQKKGNYCVITIADDMPEGETFELIATYGDYSKKLPVVIKSRHTHVAGEPVKENIVAATCETAGSYDEVVYCTDTDATEMSRKHVTVPALGHDWGEWKDENGVQVRYCKNDDTHKEVGSLTSYKITYDLDGGTMSGQKTSYTKEDGFTLPVPTKDGYKFVGWTGSNGTTAQETVTIKTGTTGDLKYVAQWEKSLRPSGKSIETGKYLGIDYELVDTTGDNAADTCLLSGTQTETRAKNDTTAPYLKEGVTDVVFDNVILSDGSYLFYNTKNLKSITGNVDTSNVADMTGMFYWSSATTLDLSSFDTSKVTDMTGMFHGSSATTLDLSNFDTSKVTSMEEMFDDSSATTLDVSSFDTSKVTNMSDMFSWTKAKTLDLSNFDTSNVTDMGAMFYGSKATTLDVSNFDTSKVTKMSLMFSYLSATTLDVSSFNTSKVTNANSMFLGSKATTIKTFKTIGFYRPDLPSGTWKGSDGKTYTQITTPGIILTKQ